MRRFAAISAPLLLLLSCTQATLAPEEVFRNSMNAIRNFTTADFVVHATSTQDGKEEWSADLDGSMASGGKQLSFHADLSMNGGGTDDASFEGDVIIPSEGEVYLKADSLSMGQGMAPFFSALTGKWWELPATGSGSAAVTVTPDPSLLAMQMETVTLVKDRGTERINQRLAYTYDVAMDQEKLLGYLEKTEKARGGEFDRTEWENYLILRTITGTVWIDSEHFLPDKLRWTIVSSDPAQPDTIELEVLFSQHNEPVSILPPASSSPFPMGSGDFQNLFAPATGSGSSDLSFPSLP